MKVEYQRVETGFGADAIVLHPKTFTQMAMLLEEQANEIETLKGKLNIIRLIATPKKKKKKVRKIDRNYVPCRECGATHTNPRSSSLCSECGVDKVKSKGLKRLETGGNE